VLAILVKVLLNLHKYGCFYSMNCSFGGWSVWPGIPWSICPEWGGQFAAEQVVNLSMIQVVNISGISNLTCVLPCANPFIERLRLCRLKAKSAKYKAPCHTSSQKTFYLSPFSFLP